MKVNIEELKRLAMDATPGPWFAEASWQSTLLEGRHDGKWAVRGSKKSYGFSPLAYVKGDKRITGGDGSLNAQFIASANPAAVLSLISEIERLRAEVASQDAAIESVANELLGRELKLEKVTKQRDELLAALKSARTWVGDGENSDGVSREFWGRQYAEAVDMIDATLAKVEG